MQTARRQRLRQWPIWLLLAGWFCANSPQAAVYAVLGWVAEAREFGHQRDLTREVAFLLVGQKAESRLAQSIARAQATQEDGARRLPALPIPSSAVIKKVDLAAEMTAVVAPPNARINLKRGHDDEWGTSRRSKPAHEPPRAAA